MEQILTLNIYEIFKEMRKTGLKSGIDCNEKNLATEPQCWYWINDQKR